MRGLIAWLVDHVTTIAILVLCIFVAGLYSYITLPREANPDITIPNVIVATPYIGVSPEDIEGLVTIPLERELAGLQDLRKLTSSSSEGVSIVVVEFEPDVVIEDALQKVRDAVSKAKPDLPADVEEPSINEISFSDIPVLLVTIAGEADEAVLKELGEGLEDKVSRIPGVLDANLTGGIEREIRVEVIPQRLSYYGLALYDVTNAIRDENVNIPGGTVTAGQSTVLVRVPGEFTTPEQLEGVAIKRVGDRPVFIRDVANVVDGTAPRETYSRMNGRASVTLSVTKRTGANILEVADAVKRAVAADSEAWPEGVFFRVTGDQSKNIKISVADLQNNIISALILVVMVVVFFMGIRNSLFVAICIPLSMLGSFMVLNMLGFTLNMVVLFSLMIALGMLVDNAIVVVENVYRHVEMGRSRRDAAIEGTREVSTAVAASTATTVAAFFPMVFWPGIMGEFMSFLPKTVIIVLLSSLVVAICFLPVFMAVLMPKPKPDAPVLDPDEVSLTDVSTLSPIMRFYRSTLLLSIRFRYLSFGSGVAMLFFTVIAYMFLNHGVELFPETEPERANIFVRAPEGSDLETTDRIVRRIEGVLAGMDNVATWVAEPGNQSDGNALGPASSADNQARITLDFRSHKNTAMDGELTRVEPTTVTIERIREQLAPILDAEVRIEKELMGPPVGKPIAIEVKGEDFHGVGELAANVRRAVSEIEGVTNLTDNYRVGRPELPLRIDRGAAKRIGVSTAGIGDTVRTAVAGAKASTLREGEDEYDIMVQLAPQYRGDLQKVLELRVPGREDTSPSTYPVPLSAVASWDFAGGTGTIRHIDQELVVTVEADVAEGMRADLVQAEVAKLVASYDVPDGFNLSIGGSKDDEAESAAFLTQAFLVACALILMILVTQFDSIMLPLIILVTVGLSLIGVLWGLVLTGTPFGVIMTGIGVVSLAGVVVNNAIVLLDYVQQLLAKGLSVQDSLVEAGLTRFRPVVLTAITTTLGLVPMATGISFDFIRFQPVIGSTSAQWWGPMAVAVIFGLSFATVLTLVMVPTLYSIYDDINGLGARVRGFFRPKTVVTATALLLLPLSADAVTLDEAYSAAVGYSASSQILSEQTRIASSQRFQAWSALQPQVSVNAGYVINEFEIALDFADSIPEIPGFEFPETEPTLVQRKEFWTADLTVSQRLFSGTAFPALRSSFKNHQAAKLNEYHQRAELKLGVASAYYGVLAAREGVSVARAGLELSSAQLERARRQVEAGSAPPRALVSARLSVSQADRDLSAATEQQVRAEEQLIRLTGLPRDADLVAPEPVAVPDDLQAALDAVDGRRDLAAAALTEDALRLRKTASDMRWLPVIDARFQYLYNQNTGFQDDPTSWQLVLSGSWNLWDGGRRLAESSEAGSQRRIAGLQARLLREAAIEEVRTAWEAYNSANSSLLAVDAELELADENIRLATRSFEVGAGTWLEVQQANTLKRSADLNAIQQRTARDLAALRLKLASGTL